MNLAVQTDLTGRIIGFVQANGNSIVCCIPVDAEVFGNLANDANAAAGYYYDFTQQRLLARPVNPTTLDKTTLTANGVDAVTLSNAPANSTLTALNLTSGHQITGGINGADSFTSTMKGQIKLTVSCWPYLDFVQTLTAS